MTDPAHTPAGGPDPNRPQPALTHRLLIRLAEEIERLLDELTPDQLGQLAAGRGRIALVPVDPDPDRPPGCRCPCRHAGGCLTCGCTCDDPARPGVCPCCGADDADVPTTPGTVTPHE